jgi:hypothetical protein
MKNIKNDVIEVFINGKKINKFSCIMFKGRIIPSNEVIMYFSDSIFGDLIHSASIVTPSAVHFYTREFEKFVFNAVNRAIHEM